MVNSYICKYTGKNIKCDNVDKLGQYVMTHVVKNGIDKFKLAESLGFELKKCISCGHYNRYLRFNVTIDDNNIVSISGIYYSLSGVEKNIQYCYGNQECELYKKHLNPNSIEFISKVNSLSYEDARNIIHVRNSSPFYRINHDSDESYKKYQCISDKIDKKEWIEKTKKGRSFDAFVKKHGIEKYKEYLLTRGTISNIKLFIKAFGELEGRKVYIERCSKASDLCIVSNKNDFYNYCYLLLKRTTILVDCVNFPIFNILSKSKVFSGGLNLYYKNKEEFKDELSERYPDLLNKTIFKLIKQNNTPYIKSYYCYTNDGILLQSKFEAECYYELLDKTDYEIILHKKYDNSQMISDFYLPAVDVHIEIAGLTHIDEYKTRLTKKHNLCKNLFICTYENRKTFIQDLKLYIGKLKNE